MILKIIYSIIVISLCGISLYCIWTHDFNLYQWLINNKFLFAAILIILIVFPRTWSHRDSFKRLTFFLFLPSKFISQSVDDAIQINIQNNPHFKERLESDEKYRNERIEELKKQFSDSTYKLRNSIYQAFITVFLVSICAILFAFILANFISITSEQIIFIRTISAFLILWALIGKLGWSIQTIGANTIPEQTNNFWFIFLNVIGSFSLFFTYFFNLFKK